MIFDWFNSHVQQNEMNSNHKFNSSSSVFFFSWKKIAKYAVRYLFENYLWFSIVFDQLKDQGAHFY